MLSMMPLKRWLATDNVCEGPCCVPFKLLQESLHENSKDFSILREEEQVISLSLPRSRGLLSVPGQVRQPSTDSLPDFLQQSAMQVTLPLPSPPLIPATFPSAVSV